MQGLFKNLIRENIVTSDCQQPGCKGKSASVETKVVSCPNILVFCIMLSPDNTNKMFYKLGIEDRLQISTDQQSVNFELKGIVVHEGQSLLSGHYNAYVKEEGRWSLYDDNKIVTSYQKLPFGKAIGKAPYLVFYQRCTTPGIPMMVNDTVIEKESKFYRVPWYVDECDNLQEHKYEEIDITKFFPGIYDEEESDMRMDMETDMNMETDMEVDYDMNVENEMEVEEEERGMEVDPEIWLLPDVVQINEEERKFEGEFDWDELNGMWEIAKKYFFDENKIPQRVIHEADAVAYMLNKDKL